MAYGVWTRMLAATGALIPSQTLETRENTCQRFSGTLPRYTWKKLYENNTIHSMVHGPCSIVLFTWYIRIRPVLVPVERDLLEHDDIFRLIG